MDAAGLPAVGMATPLWRVWKAWLLSNWGPYKIADKEPPSPQYADILSAASRVLLKCYPVNIFTPVYSIMQVAPAEKTRRDDAGTRRQGDAATRRRGDTAATRRGDTATRRPGGRTSSRQSHPPCGSGRGRSSCLRVRHGAHTGHAFSAFGFWVAPRRLSTSFDFRLRP